MHFQTLLERVIGFITMIVVPLGAAIWLARWIYEDTQRFGGAGAMIAILLVALYLYWRVKNALNGNRQGSQEL